MELISNFKKRKKAREFIRDYKDGKQVVVNKGYKGENNINEIKPKEIDLQHLTENELNKLKLNDIEKRKILANIRRKEITNDLDKSRIFRNMITPITALSREVRYLPLSIKHSTEAYTNIQNILRGRQPVSLLDRITGNVNKVTGTSKGILSNAVMIKRLNPPKPIKLNRASKSKTWGFDKDTGERFLRSITKTKTKDV